MHRLLFIVTALATALVAVSPLAARAAAAPGEATELQAAASWQGRPIQRPLPRPARDVLVERSTTLRPFTATLVRGSGFGRPEGSRQVRALQRRLWSLGYRPGPVDGRYGRRTEASVLAFQRKHGLVRDGIAGPRTVGHLFAPDAQRLGRREDRARERNVASERAPGEQPRGSAAEPAGGEQTAGATTGGTASEAPGAGRDTASEAPGGGRDAASAAPGAGRATAGDAPAATAAPAGDGGGGVNWLLLAAVVLGSLILALLVVLARRPKRTLTPAGEAPPPALEAPPWEASGPVPAPARIPSGGLATVGYASVPVLTDGEKEELMRQTAALHAACNARGWTLVDLVWDREPESGKLRDRPGLRYALDRLAQGQADCLMVSEVQRLSRDSHDLDELMSWMDDGGTKLVTLDRTDAGTVSARAP